MLNATGSNDDPGGARLRQAAASTAFGMGILDLAGHWLEANPGVERRLGTPAARLVGRHLADTLAFADPAAARAAVAGIAGGTLPALEAEAAPPDGVARLRVAIAPVRDDAGHPLYLVVHLHEAAANDGDPGRRLAEAEAALAALNRLQESLAHGVSHDLRAPLRAIDGFSALLATHLGDGLDATARDYLDRIRAATARMAVLIESLLEFSRATRAQLQRAPVDLSLLADWAHAELAEADPGRHAEVSVQPGLQAMGDERLLRQLLRQLLDNAWKFSRERDAVRIEVTGERAGERIVLRVRDHGSGFDMRYADKLFQPFQRLHGPDQAAGNGIGLAIARTVAERHGGRAWAESEPGAGSTFSIELPAVPGDDNGPGA
ncbi:MAG TPA: ATP-binding protein [Luteimonas sp.]|nr:ATP-binding protein [Luteimonas sp.]